VKTINRTMSCLRTLRYRTMSCLRIYVSLQGNTNCFWLGANWVRIHQELTAASLLPWARSQLLVSLPSRTHQKMRQQTWTFLWRHRTRT